MAKTFTFHVDPGHAWLEVSTSDLASVGMLPAEFSKYSYANRNGATPVYYLEEDCDAGKFIGPYEAKHGKPSNADKRVNGNSFVRSLPRI
jgi:hypothetical protein